MTKIKSTEWRNLPIEDWNSVTFREYLVHLTKEEFGVTYEPRGKGSKQQRWSTEMGMINNARKTYGNEVLRQFIVICVNKYQPKPQFPYMTFAFAWGYMRENMAVAEVDVEKDKRKAEAKARAQQEQAEVGDEFF